MRALGKNYELNVAFKVTALRFLMSCKREQFENMEREAKSRHGDALSEPMFEDLVGRIKEYAQQRRLEESLRRSRGDPMDIGALGKQTEEDWTGWPEWQHGEWTHQYWHEEPQSQTNGKIHRRNEQRERKRQRKGQRKRQRQGNRN